MASVIKSGDAYRIRVSSGYDVNGKQIIKSKTWRPEPGMTPYQIEKELERQKVDFEREIHLGSSIDRSVRFSEFAKRWMDDCCVPNLRKRTIRNYEGCLPRLNQAFGNKKLCEIQPVSIVGFYNALSREPVGSAAKFASRVDFAQLLKDRSLSQLALSNASGISRESIRNLCAGGSVHQNTAEKLCEVLGVELKSIFKTCDSKAMLSGNTMLTYHRVLSTIFTTAVQWQVIESNPCARVKPPRKERKEAAHLEPEDARRLMACLEDEDLKYRAMIATLLYTGMRRGELCGLTWADVDLENGLIDINKSEQYTPKDGIFEDETKNASSRRVIKVPGEVTDALKAYRAQQSAERLRAEEWHDTDKVFTQRNGLPVHPDTVSKYLHRLTEKNDLPHITVHGLRHTNASLLIAGGADIRTVSKRLGHADMSTTMNIYTHAIRKADETAAETLSLALLRQA